RSSSVGPGADLGSIAPRRREVRSRWVTLALAVASGLAGVAAFPPFDVWALGWVAPALLLIALRGATAPLGFGAGLVAGFCFQSLLGWWLFPAGVNARAYFLGAVACASYAGAFGAGAVWLERSAPAWAPLAVPSLWGVLEWVRANLGWLATPWGVLGYSQWTVRPVAGVGAVAGVWGVSFVLVGAGYLLAGLAGGSTARPEARPARRRPALPVPAPPLPRPPA